MTKTLTVIGSVLLWLGAIASICLLPFVGPRLYLAVSGTAALGAVLWGIGAVLEHKASSLDWGDPWFGYDKLAHALGSFALFVFAAALLTSALPMLPFGIVVALAAAVALAMGAVKEACDPVFSWKDLLADLVGVAVAVALAFLGR